MQAITPVSIVPSVPPTDPSLAGKVFHIDGGNAVEISGKVTAGAGSLYLLRSGNGSEWYPVDLDANDKGSLPVDATKPAGAVAGLFAGTWLTGDCRDGGGLAYYVVLQVGTATFGTMYAAQRRI